jgi:hypothetical protein
MRRAKKAVVIAVFALLVLWFVWCLVSPDLSRCTRLEVRCPEGAIHYFFFYSHVDGLFDAEVKEYIRSCDPWVIDDPNQIRSLAEAVGHVTYFGRLPSTTSIKVKIACYRGIWRVASLETRDPDVSRWSPRAAMIRSLLEPPRIQRLRLRVYCARNVGGLPAALMKRASTYPDPNRWCDAIVERLQQEQGRPRGGGPLGRRYTDVQIATEFRCPATQKPDDPNEYLKPIEAVEEDAIRRINEPVREWVSDYAMNPSCEPNSPGDTVLLFETKPGWNQHGGPELFNFDNHDPKGGCVLLNDGTVKFIRTKEEVAGLRWK